MMADILDMMSAIVAKLTNESVLGALVPIFAVWVMFNWLFAALELVFAGYTFRHFGDVVLITFAVFFYLRHLAFLARLK